MLVLVVVGRWNACLLFGIDFNVGFRGMDRNLIEDEMLKGQASSQLKASHTRHRDFLLVVLFSFFSSTLPLLPTTPILFSLTLLWFIFDSSPSSLEPRIASTQFHQARSMVDPIQSLPNEAIVRLFSLLSTSELAISSATCKQWRNRLTSDPIINQVIDLTRQFKDLSQDETILVVDRIIRSSTPIIQLQIQQLAKRFTSA